MNDYKKPHRSLTEAYKSMNEDRASSQEVYSIQKRMKAAYEKISSQEEYEEVIQAISDEWDIGAGDVALAFDTHAMDSEEKLFMSQTQNTAKTYIRHASGIIEVIKRVTGYEGM